MNDINEKQKRSDSSLTADIQWHKRQLNAVGSADDIDQSTHRLINRKFDTHILPWLFGMWLLSFIDRTNIGNAKIDGLVQDLNLQGQKFNIALAIFYVPYICVDVPSNLVLKFCKAGYYLPALLTCWGLVGTFMGFVKSYSGLLAVSSDYGHKG